MNTMLDSSNGTLRISREVLAAIARSAALEVEGVHSIAETPVVIRGMFKGHPVKPVSITIKDDLAEVGLQIIIRSGRRIGGVSERVQKAVKEAIQSMTGIAVSRVNVVIAGIDFGKSVPAVK